MCAAISALVSFSARSYRLSSYSVTAMLKTLTGVDVGVPKCLSERSSVSSSSASVAHDVNAPRRSLGRVRRCMCSARSVVDAWRSLSFARFVNTSADI